MGLTSEEREFLRVAFKAAFSHTLELDHGEAPPTVGIVDFMKYVKVLGDKHVSSKDDIIEYFVLRVRDLLLGVNSTLRELIVMVDMKPPTVKRLVVHKKRYGNMDRYTSPGDRSKRYLNQIHQSEWMRFAGNYHLLQRELYPELFNAFMSCRYFSPMPGQRLVLSGFPGRTVPVRGAPHKFEVLLWQPDELPITKRMEREDPALYHRTYSLRCYAPGPEFPQGAVLREEWNAARNNIVESDLRMFWFDHFYQREHIIFYLNDGDIFSIGALYAFERRVAINAQLVTHKKYLFRNRHTACLPFTKKSKAEEGETPSAQSSLAEQLESSTYREEYVNLDMLYAQMREYPPLVEAGVHNPVLSMVFLIILCGSDFCDKFLHGMGSQAVIWKVFMQNASVFSHMVMLGEGFPGDTRTPRTIVVDEDAFKLFVRYCFLQKYEPHRKKLKVERLSYQQLDERTHFAADMKTPQTESRLHLPDSNTIRCWCRRVEWNLVYWKNGPLGHVPDPFELWNGLPYYSYRRNSSGKAERIDLVSPKPKPVDRVYEQHLYKMRLLQTKRTE